MDNKYLWAIAGLLIGAYVAKKRVEAKSALTIQSTVDDAVNKATAIFDNMLVQAQNAGKSIADVRTAIKTA